MNEERIKALRASIIETKARMLDWKMQFEEAEKLLIGLTAELTALEKPPS